MRSSSGSDVLLEDEAGRHVRDDGVYVSVSSIKRADSTDPSEAALEITFNYYVTFRRPGRSPGIPLGPGDEGWDVVEAENLGIC